MITKEDLHRTREILHSCLPMFIALGDEFRQQLIIDIAAAGEKGINVSDLAETAQLSRPAISHHLKVLKDMGLITPKKTGTQIFYKLSIHKDLEKLSDFINSINSVIESLKEEEEKNAGIKSVL
ncbi:MAG: metalloregulator ArsR/SmtB family transcription factor [Treponema sp.]|nr:metalloregulator ArsR/SmtB family transcription factor [Treponema sp.]